MQRLFQSLEFPLQRTRSILQPFYVGAFWVRKPAGDPGGCRLLGSIRTGHSEICFLSQHLLCGLASNRVGPRADRNKVTLWCPCCSLPQLPPLSLPSPAPASAPYAFWPLCPSDLPCCCFPTRMKYLLRLCYPCFLESEFHTSFAGDIKRLHSGFSFSLGVCDAVCVTILAGLALA